LNGLNPCEVGLQTYAHRIIGLLIAAITPDDGKGEAPLLPRLNRSRPIDSTARVRFKTVKPVQVTGASHLNFVACDTNSWEQAATFQLEKLAKEGVVYCYARNDRLEFNIPYELYGNPHVYEPDFIVRLRNSLNVVTEIKGKSYEDTDAKHQAARRWVSAVNHWGRLGEWDFMVCRDPQQLSEEFAKLLASRNERISAVAAELQAQAEGEVRRLRSMGWTQADCARALQELLETKGDL
jgi:type III restriction enzyme